MRPRGNRAPHRHRDRRAHRDRSDRRDLSARAGRCGRRRDRRVGRGRDARRGRRRDACAGDPRDAVTSRDHDGDAHLPHRLRICDGRDGAHSGGRRRRLAGDEDAAVRRRSAPADPGVQVGFGPGRRRHPRRRGRVLHGDAHRRVGRTGGSGDRNRHHPRRRGRRRCGPRHRRRHDRRGRPARPYGALQSDVVTGPRHDDDLLVVRRAGRDDRGLSRRPLRGAGRAHRYRPA